MGKLSRKLVIASLLAAFSILMVCGFAFASSTYTVRSGDSLFFIANRFGVSISSIKQANGLSSNSIYPGQRLVIPGGSGYASDYGTKYIVKSGDTLYLIANSFGVTVDSIKKANKLWKDFLYPGQTLNIPRVRARTAQAVSRGFSRSDFNLLARAVYAEARGESYEGQVAVAAVILNRVKHPDFPDSIPGVIYQPGAFTCVDDGQINLTPNGTAYKAAQDAINGWDPTNGAIYYWNPATAQSKWVWTRAITAKIGNHVFAK